MGATAEIYEKVDRLEAKCIYCGEVIEKGAWQVTRKKVGGEYHFWHYKCAREDLTILLPIHTQDANKMKLALNEMIKNGAGGDNLPSWIISVYSSLTNILDR